MPPPPFATLWLSRVPEAAVARSHVSKLRGDEVGVADRHALAIDELCFMIHLLDDENDTLDIVANVQTSGGRVVPEAESGTSSFRLGEDTEEMRIAKLVFQARRCGVKASEWPPCCARRPPPSCVQCPGAAPHGGTDLDRCAFRPTRLATQIYSREAQLPDEPEIQDRISLMTLAKVDHIARTVKHKMRRLNKNLNEKLGEILKKIDPQDAAVEALLSDDDDDDDVAFSDEYEETHKVALERVDMKQLVREKINARRPRRTSSVIKPRKMRGARGF